MRSCRAHRVISNLASRLQSHEPTTHSEITEHAKIWPSRTDEHQPGLPGTASLGP